MNDQTKKFNVIFFPNDLPDFLVLKHVYEQSLIQFEDLKNQNKFVGQTFQTRCRNFIKVKVVNIVEKEPTLYKESNWETVLYIHQDAYYLRERGGRRGQRRPHDEMEEQIP